ncbi:MAG: tetratricopeptide repeat protein, partial [Candidatus Hydrothermia bacterium]
MRRTILLGLLALSCLPKQSFWAYYNSFYNCQKNFGKAEGLYRKGKSSEANQYYRKAIEKGSRILKYYPRSAYVDDALFIIGVSHLRMDDVAKAQRKFEELLLYYP